MYIFDDFIDAFFIVVINYIVHGASKSQVYRFWRGNRKYIVGARL